MKTYRVFYNSASDVEELEQFNDLNKAIEYTKGLLPSKVRLNYSNCDEHYCYWTVTEIIFDEDGDIENEIDHFVSQAYIEEEYFRKQYGYPDGVETLEELAEYIKEYGDSDCVDYICEKNGWKGVYIATDGKDFVTRPRGCFNPKISSLDYFEKREVLKLTDIKFSDL